MYIHVKMIKTEEPIDIYNADHLDELGIESGLYMIDDGVVYNLILVGKDKLVLGNLVIPRDVTVDFETTIVQNNHLENIQTRMEHIYKRIDEKAREIKKLIDAKKAENPQSSAEDLLKAIAVSQKPELIKDL